MTRIAAVVLAGVWVVACSGAPADSQQTTPTERTTPVDPTPTPATPERPRPEDVPSSTACVADSDCAVAVSAPDPESPCCDYTVTAAPMSRAYLQFYDQWRAQHCPSREACPPGALPGARLAECGYEPRCIAGACSNACSAAPRPPPGPPS